MKKQAVTVVILGAVMMALILAAAYWGAVYVNNKTAVTTAEQEESGDANSNALKEINSYFKQLGISENLEIGETYELETGGYDTNNPDNWSRCTLKYQIVDCQSVKYDSLYNEIQLAVAIYIPFEYEEKGLNSSWNIGMADRYSGLEIPTDGTHIKLEDGSIIYGSVTSESSYDSENYIYYYVYDMMVPSDYVGMDFFIAPWTKSDNNMAKNDKLPESGELKIDDYASYTSGGFEFFKIELSDVYDGTI